MASRMSKLPYMPFYPADWLSDPGLRICSKEAKAFWIDFLCILWGAEKRGIAATGGKAWSDQQVAASVSGDISANLRCLSELLDGRICSRYDATGEVSGAIFSRRIVRDEENRKDEAEKKARQRASRDVPSVVPPDVPSMSPLYDNDIEAEGELKPKNSKRFIAPSLDEIRSYCRERGNGVDPEAFLDHYESNGWKVGKNPMRDWRASVRTWEKSEFTKSKPGTENPNLELFRQRGVA